MGLQSARAPMARGNEPGRERRLAQTGGARALATGGASETTGAGNDRQVGGAITRSGSPTTKASVTSHAPNDEWRATVRSERPTSVRSERVGAGCVACAGRIAASALLAAIALPAPLASRAMTISAARARKA